MLKVRIKCYLHIMLYSYEAMYICIQVSRIICSYVPSRAQNPTCYHQFSPGSGFWDPPDPPQIPSYILYGAVAPKYIPPGSQNYQNTYQMDLKKLLKFNNYHKSMIFMNLIPLSHEINVFACPVTLKPSKNHPQNKVWNTAPIITP